MKKRKKIQSEKKSSSEIKQKKFQKLKETDRGED